MFAGDSGTTKKDKHCVMSRLMGYDLPRRAKPCSSSAGRFSSRPRKAVRSGPKKSIRLVLALNASAKVSWNVDVMFSDVWKYPPLLGARPGCTIRGIADRSRLIPGRSR